MRDVELATDGRRVVVIAMEPGEEAVAGVNEVARRRGIRAAQVTAVGGFAGAEVGYFDRAARDYLRIPVPEQVEVLSLVGDIAELHGEPALHVHAVLGRRDGGTVGGHLLRGEVWPTLEVMVSEVAAGLAKRVDPETGVAMLTGTAYG
ncbi:PPC domain-containing DNA-binding protein [Plantactinospora sp. KLBMP9567]|uniref:PPC domain-containing DNA-binding protein n=1 Tax=Plantactinospora sp. KLBMP9567 TaxID=3085900 RepID=UPI00298100A5|nr:PPC domain-containing DNA-binding protein [Plantactinospora sp. KLBMP9567]MDW5325154.1 PPC domain-containing DNA-binding protein [Plantactinospora sp. KLBMP9567]